MGSGFGPGPLTRQEIRLWQEDEHVVLERWERRAIFAIDAVYRKSFRDPETEPPKETA